MKHYGIGESWSKLFDIDISQGLQTVVAFRKNGEILITCKNGELLSYDPNTQQVTQLGFHESSSGSWEICYGQGAFFMEAYSESLVLLNVPNGVSAHKEEGRAALLAKLLVFVQVCILELKTIHFLKTWWTRS